MPALPLGHIARAMEERKVPANARADSFISAYLGQLARDAWQEDAQRALLDRIAEDEAASLEEPSEQQQQQIALARIAA